MDYKSCFICKHSTQPDYANTGETYHMLKIQKIGTLYILYLATVID